MIVKITDTDINSIYQQADAAIMSGNIPKRIPTNAIKELESASPGEIKDVMVPVDIEGITSKIIKNVNELTSFKHDFHRYSQSNAILDFANDYSEDVNAIRDFVEKIHP